MTGNSTATVVITLLCIALVTNKFPGKYTLARCKCFGQWFKDFHLFVSDFPIH